ncbi:IS3 family transposase [endosymbiont of Acanthamoeba sp. UWC8]
MLKPVYLIYIECWYNNKRRYSSLCYLSPNDFKTLYYNNYI